MANNISNKVVEKFLNNVPWSRVFKKAATASKGDRLHPSRNERNDEQANFRIDKGSNVDGVPELILQANKNAENKGVKEAAQKDSHAILAKALADAKNDPDGKGASKELFRSFKENK